jgi:hypothetical protein
MPHWLIEQVPIYLVKWKGYPSSENTWEPEDIMTVMGRGMINEYLKSQPQGIFKAPIVLNQRAQTPSCKLHSAFCSAYRLLTSNIAQVSH